MMMMMMMQERACGYTDHMIMMMQWLKIHSSE